MKKRKTSKTALVTGGARRLGREICKALAANGFNVAFTYLTSERESLATEKSLKTKGIDVLRFHADLTSREDVCSFFKAAYDKFGNPDVLINNASIFERTPLDTLNEDMFNKTINTNLKSYYLCSLEAAKYMKKQKSGKIINISSLGGTKPYKNYLPYSVSKAGVDMLTKCLALELAPHILVNSVAPGILKMPGEIRTEYLPLTERIPLERYGFPVEITNFILSLINSEYITGQVFLIDGGKVLN
jgi:NAD(P)-dependent dehydrogenase (short-subunit alcohol dehydrogenase family)